jgi:hypothetical protein
MVAIDHDERDADNCNGRSSESDGKTLTEKMAAAAEKAEVRTPLVLANASGQNRLRICGDLMDKANGMVAAMPNIVVSPSRQTQISSF